MSVEYLVIPRMTLLTRSAIAIPSILLPAQTSPIAPRPKVKTVARSKSVVKSSKLQDLTPSFVDILVQARDHIMEVQILAFEVCSTSMAQNVSALANAINFLLVAVSYGKLGGNPFHAIYSLGRVLVYNWLHDGRLTKVVQRRKEDWLSSVRS